VRDPENNNQKLRSRQEHKPPQEPKDSIE